MANPERGEVDVVVDEETFTLKLAMKAALEIQKRGKRTIGELFAAAGRLDYEAVGLLMWGLLQHHHGDRFGKIESVYDFIDRAGGPKVFFQYAKGIEELEAETVKEHDEDRPQAAQAGTGDSSRSRPGASA